MTKVVNVKFDKYDVYIGRGTPPGNPFKIGVDGTRTEVIEKYKKWFNEGLLDKDFRRCVENLRGKILGCHCKPQACHGDVIVEYLEGK